MLDSWGFKKEGRHWFDDSLGLVVEVPGGRMSSSELAHAVSLHIGRTTALIIGIEDLVVDRLAACEHRHHAESCAWAARLLAIAEDLDEDYLRLRAREEHVADALARAWDEAKRS